MAKDNPVINVYDNTGSGYEIGTETWVDNKEIESFTRTVQQDIVPSSVKSRLTGGIFSSDPESVQLGAAIISHYDALATGSSINFYFTVRNNAGQPIMAIPDVSFYVGGPKGTGTVWPGGGFGLSNMPVAVFNSWHRTDNINSVTQASMLNSSGSTQAIWCYARFRIIVTAGLNNDPGISSSTS